MCLVWVLHITLTGNDWWWLWMQCPSAFGFAKGEPAVGGSNSNIGNFPTLSTFRLLPKQNIFLHFNFQRSLTFWHTLIILNLLLLLHAYKRRIQFLQCLNIVTLSQIFSHSTLKEWKYLIVVNYKVIAQRYAPKS